MIRSKSKKKALHKKIYTRNKKTGVIKLSSANEINALKAARNKKAYTRTKVSSPNNNRIQKLFGVFGSNSTKAPDKLLFIVFLILVFSGLLMVLDTSLVFAKRDFKNAYHFLLLQSMWVAIGFIGFFIVYFINYKIIRKFVALLYAITILFLVATLFTTEVNGARSWLSLGGFSVQPAEFAKLTFTLYIAGFLSSVHKSSDNREFFINDFIPFLLLLLPILGLILLGKDLGTSMIIAAIAVVIYFYKSKTKREYLALVGMLAIFLVGMFVMIISQSYRNDRLDVWITVNTKGDLPDAVNTENKTIEQKEADRDKSYQLRQTFMGLGSGGFFGVGFAESLQKYSLPEVVPATDAVIVIISEEFGFIGSIVILTIFGTYIFAGLRIASKTQDKYGQIVVIGIVAWVGFQTFVHIASNVAVTPLTGVTLPFLSYGGSSIISIMIATGILLNISKHST